MQVLIYSCTHYSALKVREEAAVGERIVQWIRTPQVPSWYDTFYRASDWLPPLQHHIVERLLVCVEGRGRIFRSDTTQGIKMGSLYSSVKFHING